MSEEERDSLCIKLDAISKQLQYWIDFDKNTRDKEGLETDDDAYIISPPYWPSHGVLKKCIEILEDAVDRIKPPEDESA